MSFIKHLPCSSCGSSDGLADYGDHTYCFVCKDRQRKFLTQENNHGIIDYRYTNSNTNSSSLTKGTQHGCVLNSEGKTEEIPKGIPKGSAKGMGLEEKFLGWRSVTAETMARYGVKCGLSEQGKPVYFSFPCGESAFSIRDANIKDFKWKGDVKNRLPLFGMDKFASGGRTITITEGMLDALSVFQMQGSKYPCVSIVDGASSAKKNCADAFKYLASFELIYICFDNDQPGIDAAREVASLFDANKVRIVTLDKYKDANEYLENKSTEEFNKCWWRGKQYLPEGVRSTYDDIRSILSQERQGAIATYPFPTINEMAYGIRTKEVVLFTAQEGIGKTEIIRSIEHHVLKTTNHNIGIIHLEEEDKRSVQGLVSYELGFPCHLPDHSVSVDEQLEAYAKLVKHEGRVYYYSHFGTDDANGVLDIIRYLVVSCGCKLIFLDHITMMVTGMLDKDQTSLLDYISTRLAMMVHQHDFALVLVSHINDDGKTRGSRNISKVAHLHVQLDRDKMAESYEERNTTRLSVLKNRFGSKTGSGGSLLFDPMTFTVKEKNVQDGEEKSQSLSPF